jgi:hypothetical protein
LNLKIWDIVLVGSIISGIIGCFLPWGRQNPSYFNPFQDVRIGICIFSGIYTTASLIVAAIFQLVSMTTKKLYMVILVLVTTLVALFVLGAWIDKPVVQEYGLDGSYTVLYGAYVTWLSIAVASAAAFLHLAVTAEKQHSIGKLE